MSRLAHFDSKGKAKMVDVSGRGSSLRRAVASARIRLKKETIALISEGKVAKGDVLAVARIAGVMSAKRTFELIPLCHQVRLDSVDIEFNIGEGEIEIRSEVIARDRTGVEMEALVSVSASALTIYDMVKAVDREAVIEEIKLLEKEGGKSGKFSR